MSLLPLPNTTNKKWMVTKLTKIPYTAVSGQLSGESTAIFPVGGVITGIQTSPLFVATTPEGSAVDPNMVGQTIIQVPISNLEEVKDKPLDLKNKKYALLGVLAGLGLISGAFYYLKLRKKS